MLAPDGRPGYQDPRSVQLVPSSRLSLQSLRCQRAPSACASDPKTGPTGFACTLLPSDLRAPVCACLPVRPAKIHRNAHSSEIRPRATQPQPPQECASSLQRGTTSLRKWMHRHRRRICRTYSCPALLPFLTQHLRARLCWKQIVELAYRAISIPNLGVAALAPSRSFRVCRLLLTSGILSRKLFDQQPMQFHHAALCKQSPHCESPKSIGRLRSRDHKRI